MATPVLMPKVGISVESCILTKWHKQKGDAVKQGDLLFTYETDKSTIDEEAQADGTLIDVFFEEGDDVPVMTYVGVIGNPGESTAEFRPAGDDDEPAAAAPAAAAEAAAPEKAEAAPAQAVAAEGFVKISPRARNLAEKAGVDFRFAAPTGPEGRVIERDVRTLMENGPAASYAALGAGAAAGAGTGVGGRVTVGDLSAPAAAAPAATAAAPAVVEYTDTKMSNIRKLIAKSMHASLSGMAQLTHHASFDATDILNFRKKLKENGAALNLPNITINDIVLYAVSRVLKNHADLNAHLLEGDVLRRFTNAHLGMAVDTDKGLMVPTLFNASEKSLSQISAEAKELASSAQKGSINPDLLQGGTFTVTNLGTLGVEYFTPVINPPQTAILGVGTLTTKVKNVNGTAVPYQAMGLSLTFDHRAVDGAPAARFLSELIKALENFSLLLVK